MATTNAPKLDSAVRLANGAILVGWTNVVNAGNETYSQVHFDARFDGRGAYVQVTQVGYPTINQRQYTLFTAPGGAPFKRTIAYEISMRATGPAGTSVQGNSVTVPADITKAPTFNTATRTGASTVKLEFDPNPTTGAPVTATYAYGRVTGSGAAFRQVNATTSATQTVMFVSALNGAPLDGSKSYEFELDSGGPDANYSPRSSRKTVGVWWQAPAGVTDPAGAWQGTASIKLTWTGTPTTQGPYTNQQVWRAEGALGQLVKIATIAGTLRTYTDTTAKPAVAYRYEIVPTNVAGSATSRPTVNVAAALSSPSAPTGATVVYVATDKAKVTWTTKATAERPYVSQRLLRRDVGTTTWASVAALSAAATEYTDTIGANRIVEYSVEAINAAGTAASEPTSPVATTPARPASLSAAWTAPTIINLTWPAVSTIADQFNIEFTTDNITWYPAPTEGPLPKTARSWPHKDVVPTVPHWYRLNATKPSIPGTPESSWVLSVLVAALTKPLVPTLILPVEVDATANIRLGFIHNPADGTAQTKAEVRFRVQGGSTWTTRALTTSDSTTITAGTYTNGQVLEVQARTAGGTSEWSDWSGSMLITLRARPVVGSVTNSSPTSSTVTTTWTATGQATALVELLNTAGQVVEARTVGAATRTTIWTGLIDQATYSSRVTASDQYQKSTPVTSAPFTIELVRPGKPTVMAEFRLDEGDVLITTVLGVNTVRAEVFRDGVYVGDVTSGMFIDRHPPLGGQPVYTVRGYAAAGGFIDSSPVAVSTAACDVYLTYGFSTCRAGWEPTFNGVAGRESVAHRYVGDLTGPSFTFGRKLARTLDVTVTIDTTTGDTPLPQWIEASEHDRTVTYRDPSGRVLVGAITQFRFTDSDVLEQRVSFTITQAARPMGETAPDVMVSTFDFASMFTEGIQNG